MYSDLLIKNLGTVSHVDMATTAKPEEMREMFKRKLLKVAYTKGQEPHTFVLRIDGVKYRVRIFCLQRSLLAILYQKYIIPFFFLSIQITTLRSTIFKPGLANEVPVTWETDAASRDFTLNSLYLGNI